MGAVANTSNLLITGDELREQRKVDFRKWSRRLKTFAEKQKHAIAPDENMTDASWKRRENDVWDSVIKFADSPSFRLDI